MPALIYSTSLQNDIAFLLSKRSYATLDTNQKTMIDGNNLASPGGAVGRALTGIRQYANFLNLGAPDEIPVEWADWFVQKAASSAAAAFSVSEDEDLKQAARLAQLEAFQSFSMIASDDTSSTEDYGFEVQAVRRYVISSCVAGNKPVIPQTSVIDTSLESVINELWNMADWNFRQQEIEITVDTNGDITYSPAITLDKITTPNLLYTDGEQGSCVLVNDDTMRQWQSDDNNTGRPEYYRTTKSGSSVSIVFNRVPDKSYTMKASATVSLPAMISVASMNMALDLFTHEFKPLVRDWVLAKVLSRLGSNRFGPIDRDVRERIETKLYSMNSTESEEKQGSRSTMRRQTLGGPGYGDMGGFR